MDKEIFEEIIRCGVQAPSGDNLQLWIVKPSKDFESFTLSTKEEKDFFNVQNSAVFFSCGAFIENVRIAANQKGYDIKLKILDEDFDSIDIAKINFIKKNDVNGKDKALFKEIFNRATNRQPYIKKKKLPKSFYDSLNYSPKDISKLRFAIDNKKIHKLLFDADVIRTETYDANETLRVNLRYTKKQVNTRDGLDTKTLGIPLFSSLAMRFAYTWPIVKSLMFFKLDLIISYIASLRLFKTSEGIGIITTKEYSKSAEIYAGMHFENIFLNLTKYGAYLQPYASLSFFIKIVERDNGKGFSKKQINKLKEIKKEFYKELNLNENEEIMMIFRYGIAKPPKTMTLRKELSSFIKYE